MQQRRFLIILGFSIAVGATFSAGTCIIPRDLSRSAAAHVEDRSPEKLARYEQAMERGAFAEHVWVAVIAASATAGVVLGAPKLWRFWPWMGEG